MDPVSLINAYYPPGTRAHEIFMAHAVAVREKALAIARRLDALNPDYDFISSAAMLHDIGIFKTHDRILECFGDLPYICHGVAGRGLLEELGMPRHARVCECHVGVGITREEVMVNNLPLPERDMVPRTLEEEIICYADKFFSKLPLPPREKTVEEVMEDVEQGRYGPDKKDMFMEWTGRFE